MYKHIFISIIFSILSIPVSSQALSRVYDLINGNEFGTEIMVGNKGYFVLTKGICYSETGESKRCRSMLSLTDNGYFKDRSLFIDRLSFSEVRPMQLINDTIYVFGFNDFKVPWDWIIYKTNIKGDSLGKIVYNGFAEPKVVGRGITYKGNYLYLAGQTWDTGWSEKLQILVVKMDKRGNVIKEERFLNVTKSKYDYQMHDIIALDDGNFVLLYTYFYDYGRVAGIIKFDEDLNYIWHKELAHNTNHDYFPGITALDGGSILFNWEIYVPEVIDDWKEKYGKYGTTPDIFQKIDKDGNTVWADTMWTLIPESYNPAPKGVVFMMEQTKNGDIIGAGKYTIYKSPFKRRGWIFRYSADGELLWEKIYEDENFNVSYSKFYDIMEAPNGDIVCTGLLTDDDASGPPDYTWVLRVDSNGCFEPGCGISDTVQLIYTESDIVTKTKDILLDDNKEDDILIYPNPARDEIRIEFGNGLHVNTLATGVKWSIYDITGKEIMTGSIDNNYDFSISGLSVLQSGLYFLKVKDKYDTVGVGKFIID